jgi:hypothetical protein
MTTTPMPPIVPPDDSDDARVEDSAEADRLASEGEDSSTLELDPAESDGTATSADADYAASMGADPEKESGAR